MPMPPTTICSLGGTEPFFPSAEAGMKCGSTSTLPAWAAILKNRRRESLAVEFDMVGLLVGTWLARKGGWEELLARRGPAAGENTLYDRLRNGRCQAPWRCSGPCASFSRR